MGADVYAMVTDRIVEELEKGIIPWQKGWSGTSEGAYNYVSHKPYSLLNQLMLRHNDAYLTFKQVKDKGGSVKKGAKHEIVVFWKMYPVEEDQDDGTKKKKMVPVLRYFNVFWIGDTTLVMYKVTWDVDSVAKYKYFDTREEADEFAAGLQDDPLVSNIKVLEPKYNGREAKAVEHEPIKEAEGYIQQYLLREPELSFENTRPSNRAFYRPSTDTVVVPMMSQFANLEEYYSTAFHELTHSTGNVKRLNRLVNNAAFGSEDYSKEELVAELGASYLVNLCGIETEKSFRNNAGYIQGWLSALKNDKRLIVSAAGKAEKAVKYIMNGKDEVTKDE